MSEQASVQDRYKILKKFVLNNDAASIQLAFETDDQTDVLNYTPFYQAPLLCVAAENNFVSVAKLLLHAAADVNGRGTYGRSSLASAALCGHEEMATLLLEQPDVALDANALMHAAGNGHIGIVQRLLEAKANVGYSLIVAADAGQCKMLALLLQKKADVDKRDDDGNGCLHAAARQGRTHAVSFLLAASATVDLVNKGGETPLMSACETNHLASVRLLLAAGADASRRDFVQRTTLHYGSTRNSPAIVDELLKARADPNATDYQGRTALSVAPFCYDSVDTMKSLLNAKADINVTDKSGETALIQAVAIGSATSVEFLLKNGADLLLKRKKSARQLARLRTNGEVVALFECSLCGWEGMCCLNCRNKYCVIECDKVSDSKNSSSATTVNCKLHRKLAHQSVLEWTLAMASLNLPPYVLEIIFKSLQLNSTNSNYQQRKGMDFLWIPNRSAGKINSNFIHLIIEERTHQENIKLFISVQKAHQNTMKE